MVALFFGHALINERYDILMGLLIGVPGLLFCLYTKTEYLIYLTFYVLVAGSSYDQEIRSQVFYVRFAIFGLYCLRFIPYILNKKNVLQPDVFTAVPETPLKRFHFSFFHFLIACYMTLAFISSVYSIDKATTFQRAVAILVLFGAVFIYLYEVTDSWEKIAVYMKVMVKSTMLLLMSGFVFYALGLGSTTQSSGRLRLFLFGPNELGYICAILFPACFWYYSETKKRFEKFFTGVGLILLVAALVLTASRGSLLCFGLSGFLLVWLAYRRKLLLYSVLVFLFLAITYIFAPPRTDRLMQLVDRKIVRSNTLESGSGRLPIWNRALELSSERPWFGYGFGSVNSLFLLGYFTSVLGSFQGEYLHNSYLELLLDLGYVGLLLLLTTLIFVFVRGISNIRRLRGTPHYTIAVMVFCCFFSGITSALFETWMTSPGSVFSFPFWYCAALLIRMKWVPEKTEVTITPISS